MSITESLVSCETAKSTWTNLVHNSEGPSDTKESIQGEPKVQKDYKSEYKKMKAKLALLEASPSTSQSSKPFQSKNKGLVAKTFDWDEKEVSNDDEKTQVRVLMALADDELSVGKNHLRNGEWMYITMKKVNIPLSIDEDSDWQTYLKYINIDLKYVEEQRLNLLSKYNKIVFELNKCRDDLLSLKQAKLEAVTFQIQNTELTKLNHALHAQPNEERKDRWSRDQHIELVNIIGDPGEGMLTRSMAAKLTDASASESIGSKWVFRNKKDEQGIVTKNKARLTAQGYSQEEGIDYDETFAPVALIKAIEIFLALDTYMNFIVFQIDVKSAFLNGKLKEKIYVKQPPGFENSEFLDYVCKLDKSLYGLKQAPGAWYETLSTILISLSREE
uniref:Copia protein n=1 Tax=Tanacetum cinerariifolium TaxID=118510 RepID=A0A6L2J8N4_TANCI|nr:copia protein [Tanacetum cinerariifolium]